MNLEDIMLSEICQAEKDKYCVISLKYEILRTPEVAFIICPFQMRRLRVNTTEEGSES